MSGSFYRPRKYLQFSNGIHVYNNKIRHIIECSCHISYHTDSTSQDYRYYIHGRCSGEFYSLIPTVTPTMTFHATSTEPIHLHFLPIPNVKRLRQLHTVFQKKNSNLRKNNPSKYVSMNTSN